MHSMAQTGTAPQATAVNAAGLCKVYTQSQRANAGQGLLQGLLKPKKKRVQALDAVSFAVERGEFVAYAGPNGAGKSTTIKLLGGLLTPDSGELAVLGLSPQRQRVQLMRRIGVLFGNRTELWWDHPISQSFEWKRVVWDIPEDQYRKNFELVTELLELQPLLGTFARELSLGQRMRCDLGMMLLHSPELILLDEPTLGLDVVAKRQMIQFLKRLNREEGTTVVVTSHDMDDLEEMAQRIIMVSSGSVVYDGAFDGLRTLTGSLSRLQVHAGPVAPDIGGCALIESQNGVHTYEVDLVRTPVKTLLYSVSQLEGVDDVEIRKAPIEQVIAELYGRWKH